MTSGAASDHVPLWQRNAKKAERNGVRKTCYFPGRSSISWEDRIEKQEYDPTSLALNKWKTKETYSGEWKDNKRHGYGTQITSRGKYAGEWKIGKRDGKGIYHVFDNNCKQKDNLRKEYAGEWQSDKKHGFGIFYFKKGDVYEGFFHEGVRHGEGRMLYANGDEYNGNWVHGQRSGRGKVIYANGDEYVGTWLLGKKEGSGEYYYKRTNRVLVGEWQDDVAACGVFAELDADKILPECTVEDVNGILKERILEIRKATHKKRIEARLSIPDVVFSKVELNRLRRKFKDRLFVDSTTVSDEDIIFILESENLDVSLQKLMKNLRNRKWTFNDLLVLASASR